MYDIHILHTARHLYILLREGYALLKCFSLLFVSTTSLGSCNAIIVVCAELKNMTLGMSEELLGSSSTQGVIVL